MIPTIESITKKLGYNPLTHQYLNGVDCEDDSIPNPYSELSIEELDCIIAAAKNDPRCWTRANA